jgi:hypothetical protein
MSESDGERVGARPRQVTIAGVMATAACLLLVVSLFDSMAMVRSADVRRRIAEELSRPPGNGLGLEPAAVVEMLRALVLVSGALAAAGAVLSIFVLQRHKGARVGLSVIAVLMLFSASFVSGLLPILVAVAASMLWGREARDWFAGRPPRPAVEPPGTPGGSRRDDARADASGDVNGGAPAGMSVWQPGPPADRPENLPAPATRPYGTPPAAYPPPQQGYLSAPYAPPRARPTPVAVAAWLTWVFSGLVAVFFMIGVLTILADHEALVGAMQRNARVAEQGFSARELLGALWITCAVGIFWSLASMSLAVLAYRRLEIGRVVLTISAAVAGLVGLAAVPVGWPPAAAAITCVVLLNRPSVRAWFAGQDLPPRLPRPPQGPRDPSEKPPVW